MDALRFIDARVQDWPEPSGCRAYPYFQRLCGIQVDIPLRVGDRNLCLIQSIVDGEV